MYARALAGKEKALGPDHPDTLKLVNNLADIIEKHWPPDRWSLEDESKVLYECWRVCWWGGRRPSDRSTPRLCQRPKTKLPKAKQTSTWS